MARSAARAMGDQIVGAVEIQPADLADPGRNQKVRRIAGQPGAGDPVLHDVEGIHHDVEMPGRPAPPKNSRLTVRSTEKNFPKPRFGGPGPALRALPSS
jgi:hypothetical protein